MKHRFSLLTALIPLALSAAIPTTPGWYEIPNTKMADVSACAHGFTYACGNTTGGIYAWSGGVFDTKRNRLIVHGGGHTDYRGNEIYALNLDSLTFKRITDPGSPTASGCAEDIANGTQPNSRHTYDGISYMPNVDKMYVFSGSLACGAGNFGTWTWTFDFAAMKWTHATPTGTGPGGAFGIVSAYDSNTGKVFVHDLSALYAYDPVANTYQKFANTNGGVNYHCCGVVDPKRKKFVIIGSGDQWVFDISGTNYARQSLNSTGGSTLVNSAYPGLAYDSKRDRIVAWNGGNDVYSLDMDTKQWTKVTYTGGAGANAFGSGTYKRWSYAPALDAFVLNNSYNQNSYAFRFPGSGTAVETSAAKKVSTALVAAPNPARAQSPVHIKLSGAVAGKVSLVDARGMVVSEFPARENIAWNARAAAPGVYAVVWRMGNGKIVRTKLVIF